MFSGGEVSYHYDPMLAKLITWGADRDMAEIEVAPHATPVDVIKLLGMPPENPYLVILNGASVARREHGSRTLSDGDVLAIMPPLRGG